MNKFNVFDHKCPARAALEMISDKWTILIIEILAEKPHRFLELQRAIGGISKKVLASTLKILEKNGFILRCDQSDSQLKVEYSLTPVGKSLSQIFMVLTDWAENNIDTILLSQSHYQEALNS